MLNEIVKNYIWTPYGIQCPDVVSMRQTHTFLRELIMDRHLYVSKVVGFRIKSSKSFRVSENTYISRHKQLADSYTEIMMHLANKVFICNNVSDVSVELQCGENTLGNITCTDKNNNTIQVLSQDHYVCRVIQDYCTLELKLLYDCGYRSNQQNSKILCDKDNLHSYFPSFTDFSINDLFRVLPPMEYGTIVPIRCYNGGTFDLLKNLIVDYTTAVKLGKLRKEEKVWLSRFEA